jgi:hypothetical protein
LYICTNNKQRSLDLEFSAIPEPKETKQFIKIAGVLDRGVAGSYSARVGEPRTQSLGISLNGSEHQRLFCRSKFLAEIYKKC